ncbi:MAG: hypothetical protein KA796_03655 [Chryseobacterium sp.]|nr:hypothetical protein [Chryseobacterium sp.]MBP7498947.1 hypothetical protein [Chryseobacterium sp.]
MNITDKFNDGINKGLTLQQVYQGTSEINKTQLRDFLINSFESELVPRPNHFELCELKIDEYEIEVIPEIFNTNKSYSIDNQIDLGNLSESIGIYFNHFFKPNWYGIVENFQKFNSGKYVIGGNPEYILWCINEAKNFNIDLSTLKELEKLKIYRFKGIKVEMISQNHYQYTPIVEDEYFKFKIQLLKI